MHRGILRVLPVCLLSSSAFADRPFAGSSALLQLANATSDKCDNKVKEDGSLCCPPIMRNKYSVSVADCTDGTGGTAACTCGFVFAEGTSTYSQRHAKKGDVICKHPCHNEDGSMNLMFFEKVDNGNYVFNQWTKATETTPATTPGGSTGDHDEDEVEKPVTEPRFTRPPVDEKYTEAQLENFELLDYCEALDALVKLPAQPDEFKRFLRECTTELEQNVRGLEAMYTMNEAAATKVKTEVGDLEPEISKFTVDKSPAVFKIGKQLRDHELKSVKDAHEVIDAAYREVQQEYASIPELPKKTD